MAGIVTGREDCNLDSAWSFDRQTAGFVEVGREQRREKVQWESVADSTAAHRGLWMVGNLATDTREELRPFLPYS